ncbi:hypothetical protein BC833DRAFT_590374 [Globomyces pollinis-pini]|nr:hypothetical protein BC833DRAFT_590374 [Globomyces pollinis-pini]
MQFTTIVLSLLAVPSMAITTYCVPQKFCVYGEPNDSTGKNVTVTVHSASSGWVGFGVGASMAKAVIYVNWKNPEGNNVFSTRFSSGRKEPFFNATAQIAGLVPLKTNVGPTPSWAKQSFSFTRPAISATSQFVPNATYIYAWSDTPPASLTDMKSSFSMHGGTDKGSFPADFTTDKGVLRADTPSSGGSGTNGTSSAITQNSWNGIVASVALSFLL